MKGKRIFDLFLTIPGIILLTPFFFIIAVWIKMDSEGPVFFRQARVGRYGKLFYIYKFRTMIVDAEEIGRQITVGDDFRITRSGRFLRKYKLDELPQLLNILFGEMSLVGPRPEVPKYVEKYPDDLRDLVLAVLPGITDFASVEFCNENEILARAVDPEKTYLEEVLPVKLDYCKKYVQERSFLVDLKLIAMTFHAIIKLK